MMVSIESGIAYIMITSKSYILYKFFENVLDIKKLLEKYRENIELKNKTKTNHNQEIEQNLDITDNNSVILDDIAENEFNELETILHRYSSYNEAIDRKKQHNVISTLTENKSEKDNSIDEKIISMLEIVVDKNVIRTVDFDNRQLSMSFKEYLIFNEITKWAIIIDNIFRILLPTIFFTIIIIIFSYK